MLAGADLTILRNNLEHRFDLLAGKWLGNDTYALFYRFGVNLDPEGRLKIEAQPTYWKFGEEEDYQMSLCLSSQATSNLTVRSAYTYDHNAETTGSSCNSIITGRYEITIIFRTAWHL